MGCQISKEEEKDEKRQEQSNDTDDRYTTNAMASKSLAAINFKSRLEWKLCLVC